MEYNYASLQTVANHNEANPLTGTTITVVFRHRPSNPNRALERQAANPRLRYDRRPFRPQENEYQTMRQAERVVATALADVVVSGATAQDAGRRRVEGGGNRHWYQAIDASGAS